MPVYGSFCSITGLVFTCGLKILSFDLLNIEVALLSIIAGLGSGLVIVFLERDL